MPQPRAQQIYNWILTGVDAQSPSQTIFNWVKEAIDVLGADLTELERLELIPSRVSIVQPMLIQEQTRATAAGMPTFEVVGEQAEFLRGFGLPLPGDSAEILHRRERARLRDQVWTALTALSPENFETLWRLVVGQLGGSHFVHRGSSGDEGVDFTAEFRVYQLANTLSSHVALEWLEATRDRSIVTVIGQAKHWPGRIVQPANLRELLGTIVLHIPNTSKGERKGVLGMLVTTGRFSRNTYERAYQAGLILLDGEWVVSAIVNFGLGIRGTTGSLSFSQTEFVN